VFNVFEQSILELQSAQIANRVSSRGLVDAYLARIAAYDSAGPRLNAIVTLNPRAREDADVLDRERAAGSVRGPLHGIPVLVKDNFDTTDIPTSGGTLALATLQPDADAFQVKRLREAGAVILGKTTMHELAAGVTTVSSLTGQTRNPYDLSRVPGGSSGGTGAAVAGSFAAAGMGSDTCGSIRIPAANQNLVGLRATSGLSSRSGVIPLSPTQDVAGPLARTVTDLALMLDATVGTDPADDMTRDAARYVPASYRMALTTDGLKGARIGVLRSLFGNAPEDEEVAGIVQKALDAMKAEGAEIIDVIVPGLDQLLPDSSVVGDEFKFALADYLARHPSAAVKSLSDILERGLNHDALDARFRLRNAPERTQSEHYRQALIKRRALRWIVLATFEAQHIDAIAYPTGRRKPAPIGEPQPPDLAGRVTNCQLSATTGLPAISIPAGFTVDGLPIGLELLGGAFAETTLLKLAYAWEQAAHPRRAPFSTPPLAQGAAPPPVTGEAIVGGSSVSARVTFRYDHVTGVLVYDATVTGLGSDRVIALTLQRGEVDKPGPILVHLLSPEQTTAHEALTLRGRDREDFVAGEVYVHLYTRQSPLGVGRTKVSPAPQLAVVPPPRAGTGQTQRGGAESQLKPGVAAEDAMADLGRSLRSAVRATGARGRSVATVVPNPVSREASSTSR
jgi:Asp-tRNA(Asn)/Glu-tRNA(Gln) amidotransferase A subunit family amidase